MREQIAAFGFNKYGLHISSLSNRWVLQKKLIAMATFVAGSLVSFFNLLFSRYVLKLLTTF